MPLDPVLDPVQLRALPDAVLLDVRTGPDAQTAYQAAHLAGAHFADLERDLSQPTADAAQGGRHPLPDPRTFAARLGRWGIGPETHVVVYDDQGGANAAARAWWMLRALGHTRVQLLDGGLRVARAAGCPENSAPPAQADRGPYPLPEGFTWPVASLTEVDAARRDPARLVLDVRAAARFRGEHEPIDPIAGHIPGAENLPLSENLDASGRFKPGHELRALYAPLLGERAPERVIVHCGSGVTACHSLLALERAGLEGAQLYVGSWSEWCRRPELPRAP